MPFQPQSCFLLYRQLQGDRVLKVFTLFLTFVWSRRSDNLMFKPGRVGFPPSPQSVVWRRVTFLVSTLPCSHLRPKTSPGKTCKSSVLLFCTKATALEEELPVCPSRVFFFLTPPNFPRASTFKLVFCRHYKSINESLSQPQSSNSMESCSPPPHRLSSSLSSK